MRTYITIVTTTFLAVSAQAQTLQDAILKTENERYDAAAADFRALIAKESTKGENYFYYGENYFEKGDLDSANIIYQKGVDMNATNPLNYVGLGKVLWFNGKTADAKTQFFRAATLSQNKSAEVMRRTAEAYIDASTKNLDEAIALLNNAIKLEPKNAENHILMGDALLEKNPVDGGPAIKEYNKATELDPKSPAGILRSGKLYQRARNFKLADDYYKQAQAIDPNFAPAYRTNAELYMLFQQPAKAIELWKKYLALNNSNDARYRFATALFSNKQYCDALPELENLQKNKFNNFYVERMMSYSYYECGDKTDKEAYNKGLGANEQFFKMVPQDKIISSDYKYKGLLLSKLGKDSLAVIELEKASSIDTSKTRELAGDVAKLYFKMKKYDKAISTYQRKMNGDADNLTGNEFLELGRAYYFGPKDYVQADSAFSKITQKAPTYALAYLWRGRANYQVDLKNETENKDKNPKDKKWSARPHYEKFLDLVKPEERTTSAYKLLVIEATKYLGDYYVNSKDKNMDKAKDMWKLVSELDPSDKQAKAFFAPKQSNKPGQ